MPAKHASIFVLNSLRYSVQKILSEKEKEVKRNLSEYLICGYRKLPKGNKNAWNQKKKLDVMTGVPFCLPKVCSYFKCKGGG